MSAPDNFVELFMRFGVFYRLFIIACFETLGVRVVTPESLLESFQNVGVFYRPFDNIFGKWVGGFPGNFFYNSPCVFMIFSIIYHPFQKTIS